VPGLRRWLPAVTQPLRYPSTVRNVLVNDAAQGDLFHRTVLYTCFINASHFTSLAARNCRTLSQDHFFFRGFYAAGSIA
jgi:hypothetical protein